MIGRTRCASGVALLVLVCSAAVAPAAAAEAALEAALPEGGQGELSSAEQQYRRALEIRDLEDASQKELRQAVKLLYAAAGIQHLSMARPAPAGAAAQQQQQQQQQEAGDGASAAPPAAAPPAQPQYLSAASVRLELRNDTQPHLGALKELVYVYREGDGVPANPAIAHRLLQLLAELGHAESQADVAFHLALGIDPVAPNPRDQLFRLVEPDPAAALVHYTFAAHAGDPVAQMSLGYRHLYGIDVPRSCQTATLYYAPVAEKVLSMAQVNEGLPEIEGMRLSHKTAHSRRGLSTEQEVLHYQWFADFGNMDAAREAARMLAHGNAADHEQAVRYLLQAAEAGDGDAMAHLGNMYANGAAGVAQDNETAISWYWKAAERGHPGGYLGLGYMHMAGHGTPRDYGKAQTYLDAAVRQQGYGRESVLWRDVRSSAAFYLGLMHLRGWGVAPSVNKAVLYWEKQAAAGGHLLASYNLAMLYLGGHAAPPGGACPAAVRLLKAVAERGFPAQQEANDDFMAGDYEWALLNYLKAAEMGVETGQSNAAWMLTEGYGYEGPEAGRAALLLYKRAAAQGNHGALLRIGDSYWYGKGVARDWRRAAQMYHEAGRHSSLQALYNQGYMHQFGAGLPQDFHLAKRYYDDAMSKAQKKASSARRQRSDAELPLQLALAFLRVHQWWEGVRHRLPPRVASAVTAALFTVTEHGPPMLAATPHHSPARAGGAAAWAQRARRLLTLDFLFDTLDDLFDSGDNVDLTVAMGLLLVLALVLWRRRMVRAQNQQRQFVMAGMAAPVPEWAGQAPPAQAPPAQAPPAAQQQQEAEAPLGPPAAQDEAAGSSGAAPSGSQQQGQPGADEPPPAA